MVTDVGAAVLTKKVSLSPARTLVRSQYPSMSDCRNFAFGSNLA
jgi:hypothetical protein